MKVDSHEKIGGGFGDFGSMASGPRPSVQVWMDGRAGICPPPSCSLFFRASDGMVDMHDLGSCGTSRGSSNLPSPTLPFGKLTAVSTVEPLSG